MAMCLCCALLLPAPALGAKNFSDIKGHWANADIIKLSAQGSLKGYPDGTFKPDRSMSRAEFTTALITSLGITPTVPNSNSFKDTKNHWARKYIEEAVKRDILIPSEFPEGLDPDQNILRSQAAAMLIRALGMYPSAGQLNFTDRNEVALSLYRNYIKAACDAGIMTGFPDGSFAPFKAMTRAQVCTVLIKTQNKKGTTATTAPTVTQPITNTITAVAVGEDLFDLNDTTITLDTGTTDTVVTNLSVTNDALTVNDKYVFALNSTTGNPDIIIGNTRFGVKRMTVSSNKLVIYPLNRRINELELKNRDYKSNNVNMYINSSKNALRLSDLEIINETDVEVKGKSYILREDKITIEVNNAFYDIVNIKLQPGNTVPSLQETDQVIDEGLTMSDISAIYVNNKSLNLKTVDYIDFIIDGERYKLSETTLNSSGTFTFDRETYRYSEVIMSIDNTNYKISNIKYLKGKFTFYCQKSNVENLVKFNNVYRDYDDIIIVKGSTEYDFNEVTVLGRNQIRINGKQYSVTEVNIQCKVDKKRWDIKTIEWNNSLEMVYIKAVEVDEESENDSQPVKFVLYDEDNHKLADGSSSQVRLYVSGKWIAFSAIKMSDPNYFSYNGASYKLIGSRVKINTTQYKINDTVWHGGTQIIDLYLTEY